MAGGRSRIWRGAEFLGLVQDAESAPARWTRRWWLRVMGICVAVWLSLWIFSLLG